MSDWRNYPKRRILDRQRAITGIEPMDHVFLACGHHVVIPRDYEGEVSPCGECERGTTRQFDPAEFEGRRP